MAELDIRRLDFLFPVSSYPRTKKILSKRLLIIIALLPLVYALSLSTYILGKQTPGFGIEITQNGFLISHVATTTNEVESGNTILEIDGVPYYRILGAAFQDAHLSGPPLKTITLESNGTQKTINYQSEPIGFGYYLKRTWASFIFVITTAFLMITAVLKSSDEQPSDLMLLTYSLFSIIIIADFPSRLGILDTSLISTSFIVVVVSHWLAFSSWTHFVFQFPVERQVLSGRPVAVAGIYILPPLVAIIASLLDSKGSAMFYSSLQHYKYWATPLLILCTFVKHIFDYLNLGDSIAKRQLKLFMIGISVGIAPYIFLYLAPHIIMDKPLITFNTVIIAGLIIPLTISVAMTKYKMMDVDQLISKGLAYIILLYSFIFLYSSSVLLIEKLFRSRGISSNEFSMFFIMVVALVFNPLKNRLQLRIDRLFLRNPLDYDLLLYQFSSKAMKSLNLSGLVNLLLNELPRKFRIRNTALVISYDDQIRCYPENSLLTTRPDHQQALLNSLEDVNDVIYAENGPATEKYDPQILELFALSQSKLAFRLAGSKNFKGALCMGAKKNKRMYTSAELQVFSTLANYISIALENAFMYESVKASRDQIHEMFNKVTQAEKLAAIGEMTTVLTHEIRNPLAVIRSSAEFLKNKIREPQIQDELLSNILNEIDMLNIVVENTLNMARYAPPKFRKIDLTKLMTQLIEQWKRSPEHLVNVEISLITDEFVPEVYADKNQLTQVFVNLIKNSEEAMSGSGKIQIQIKSTIDGKGVWIRIEDDGPGITREQEKVVFKKFFTAKKGGLGLGLAVCDQIVSAHNGTITLKNRNTLGACAKIYLPCRPYRSVPVPDNFIPGEETV